LRISVGETTFSNEVSWEQDLNTNCKKLERTNMRLLEPLLHS